MISECLKDINEPTDIDKFYNQESPNKNPPLLICKDKRYQQNKDIEENRLSCEHFNIEQQLMGSYNRYNFDMCNESLNHHLYTKNKKNREANIPIYNYCLDAPNKESHPFMNKQFIHKPLKNTDVESDLLRINHFRDKCYNDNYKINHNHKSFSKFRNIYNKQKKLMENIKNKSDKRLPILNENCLENMEEFEKCSEDLKFEYPVGLEKEERQHVNYNFSNQDYCRGYACQSLFNNVTRRNMLPTLNTRKGINPCDYECPENN